MLVRVNGTEFKRDTTTMALINNDANGLNEYLMKRELAKKQQEEQSQTKDRLEKLENDMSEIKSLLRDIVEMRKV